MSEHYKITFFSITSPNTPQNSSNNPHIFKKSCLCSTQNSTTTTLLKETALKLFTIQKKNPLSPPKHFQVHIDVPFTLNPSTLNWVRSTPFQKSANPPSWSQTVLQNKHKKADAFASAFIFVEPLICYTLLPFGRDAITWR